MATPTYDLIGETILSTATSTVTFSNLDTVASSYKHLVAVVEGRPTDNLKYAYMNFNGSFPSNSDQVSVTGFGSSGVTSTNRDTNRFFLGNLNTSTWRTTQDALAIVEIFNFADSNQINTGIIRFGQSGETVEQGLFRGANSDAITSITFGMNGSNFAIGGTFKLFGIVG